MVEKVKEQKKNDRVCFEEFAAAGREGMKENVKKAIRIFRMAE